jgi:hypothetical protein
MMPSNAAIPDEEIIEEVETPIIREGVKVSWGAIVAGLVVTLGTWALLTVLGLALGLSQADPNTPGSLRSAGMVTGVWSLIVPFIALLFGGMVAARTAGVLSRPIGAIHGVVLWGLATIASIALVGYVVRGAVNAAISAGATLTGAASDVATSRGVRQANPISAEDLVGPINQRLRAEGKPPVSPAELEGTMRDIAQTAVREGRVDRDLILSAVTANTRLSPTDAQELATRIEQKIEQQRAELGQDAEQGAARVADRTGKAMWWVFFGMLIGLGASVAGSTLAVRRTQRIVGLPRREREHFATTREAHST